MGFWNFLETKEAFDVDEMKENIQKKTEQGFQEAKEQLVNAEEETGEEERMNKWRENKERMRNKAGKVWMMFRVKAKDKLEEVEEHITDMKVGLENWSGRKNGPKNMKDMRQSLKDLIKSLKDLVHFKRKVEPEPEVSPSELPGFPEVEPTEEPATAEPEEWEEQEESWFPFEKEDDEEDNRLTGAEEAEVNEYEVDQNGNEEEEGEEEMEGENKGEEEEGEEAGEEEEKEEGEEEEGEEEEGEKEGEEEWTEEEGSGLEVPGEGEEEKEAEEKEEEEEEEEWKEEEGSGLEVPGKGEEEKEKEMKEGVEGEEQEAAEKTPIDAWKVLKRKFKRKFKNVLANNKPWKKLEKVRRRLLRKEMLQADEP